MKKMLLILIALCFCSLNIYSQAISQLNKEVISRIKDKSTFDEMVNAVEAYYDSIPNGRDKSSYKHWARWAYNMSMRTDDNNRLVDVEKRNSEAIERYDYKDKSRASVGNWESLGPNSISHALGSAIGIGRADRIAFHPTDSNIIYVGTSSGGLWKTTDGGITWNPMTDGLPTSGISGIVVSNDNPNTIYILTGDGDSNNGGGFVNASGYIRSSNGVYVSYSGGQNWKHLPLPITDTYYGFRLVQSNTNPDVLLAATSEGLLRTDDGGNNWTQEIVNATVVDIEFKPGSGTIVYCCGDDWFGRSSNGGLDWTFLDSQVDFSPAPGIEYSNRLEISVSGAAPNNVYIVTSSAFFEQDDCDVNNSNSFQGVFKSSNSGLSFIRVDIGSKNLNSSCCFGVDGREQAAYNHAFAVSNVDEDDMVAGGIHTWRSTNEGASWGIAYVDDAPTGQCSGTGITGFIHGDIHDLAYQPGTNRLWACTDGGVYHTDNHGLHWDHKCSGLVTGQIYHLAVSDLNTNVMMIGQQDNGTRAKLTNTTNWKYVSGADGFDVIYNNNSSTNGFCTVNKSIYEFNSNGDNLLLISSTDNFFHRVSSNVDDPDIFYAGGEEIKVREKTSSGWNLVRTLEASGFWGIERCLTNSNKFYFGGGSSAFATTGFIKRTTDNFDDFENLNAPFYSQRITDIAVHPTNDNIFWYCFGGYTDTLKVFRSINSGTTLVNMTDNLPNIPMLSIAVHTNGDVYLGTDVGVFYRGNNMVEWIPFYHNLPKVPVTDLEISQGKITAATFGRGVWQSDLHSSCTSTANITLDMTGNQIIERSQQITATNQIYGGASGNIIFKAGNQISLLPGFHVPAYNNFNSYLKPCGDW